MILASTSSFGSTAARDALHEEAQARVARASEMIARARALVLDDRVRAVNLLTRRRIALAACLLTYQRFKHGSIFDPVVQYGSPSSQIVARSMKTDCLELGQVFGAHHDRWRALHPADWRVYRADMLAITETLVTRMEAELRAIRQLLMIAELYDR